MNVTAHDTISIYLKSFIILAEANAIKKNVPVFSSYKDIKPLNNCEGNKMNSLLVTDFKFSAHEIANGYNKYIRKSIDLQHCKSKSRCRTSSAGRLELGTATDRYLFTRTLGLGGGVPCFSISSSLYCSSRSVKSVSA